MDVGTCLFHVFACFSGISGPGLLFVAMDSDSCTGWHRKLADFGNKAQSISSKKWPTYLALSQDLGWVEMVLPVEDIKSRYTVFMAQSHAKARRKEMLEIGRTIDFSTCFQLAFVFVIGVLGAVHFRDACRQTE